MPARAVAAVYLRWIFVRAAFHRGWWLVASLYLVVVAELSAFELVFIGVAQGVTGLVFEVPTGVIADTISRKRSLLISHALMGTAMLATGLVTSFPALVATQMLWGLSWTFASGADVAWLTDEMDQPERVATVLTSAARWDQIGAAAGMIGLGAFAWSTDLSTAMIVSGAAMLGLGGYVALRFVEDRFTPRREARLRASASIFQRGLALARGDRQILIIFGATLLVNGAAEGFGRLYAKRLIELGLPTAADPIVWLTALGLASLATAALALRIMEGRIEREGAAWRTYLAACAVGTVGLVLLAIAPDAETGMAGALLVSGIAWSLTRCVSVIWVNRRATSEVRATLQSFLSQAEYAGEIGLGIVLGVLAQAISISAAMFGSAALVIAAGLLVSRSGARSTQQPRS